MNKNHLLIGFVLGLWLLASLACSLFTPAAPTAPVLTEPPTLASAPTDMPLPPPTETPTAAPLHLSLTLTAVHFEETGQAPNYTITSETPALTGADDPRVEAFNAAAAEIVQGIANEFTASLKYQPAVPLTSGSFIDVDYEVLSPPGNILSLRFNVVGYGDGAAHPFHYAQTLTWDIERGERVTLEQLFLPGMDYLQALSDYSKAELSGRDIAFDAFSTGADPSAENYRNWNISAGGLVTTFDEYQVAAYAAGAQIVVIPWSALRGLLDPLGPAAAFIP